MHGIAVGGVAGVDQMRDQARALDVPQKADAQPHAGMRAFDQAGQIGDDERAPAHVPTFSRSAVGGNHAEARLERGKRIIGDFRTRRGNARNQRGFARVRKTHQTHVGQQLQFEAQVALLAGLALFGFARRLMPGLGEMLVAAPAAPALREQNALAGLGQIGKPLAGSSIGDHGADRHQQNHVRAGMAGAVRAFAVAAAVGLEFAIEAVAQQRVVVRIGFEVNAAAMAAVAARGPAARHEFFAAKRDAAVPAVAGLHVDFGFVNKHDDSISALRIRHCRVELHLTARLQPVDFALALLNPQAEACATGSFRSEQRKKAAPHPRNRLPNSRSS